MERSPGYAYRNRGKPAAYDAELFVFGDLLGSRDSGMSLADATELIHKHAPGVHVERKRRRRGGRVAGGATTTGKTRITLGQYAGKPLVLHEIAHALTPTDTGHGRAWRAEYLRLIKTEMGSRWYHKLRKAFRAVGYTDV